MTGEWVVAVRMCAAVPAHHEGAFGGHLSREVQACRGPAVPYESRYVSTGVWVCMCVCVFVLYLPGLRQTMSAAADASHSCQELSLNN